VWNEARSRALTKLHDLVLGAFLTNVDMANGLSGVYGACLYAVNTPLTIKGGQFSGCKLTSSSGLGGAILNELSGASTLSKGPFISKTNFINNTGGSGGAIYVFSIVRQVSARVRVVVRSH